MEVCVRGGCPYLSLSAHNRSVSLCAARRNGVREICETESEEDDVIPFFYENNLSQIFELLDPLTFPTPLYWYGGWLSSK